ARVVEVDMGQKQRPGPPLERREQYFQAGGGPGIDQDVVDLPAADHPLIAEVVEIDDPHPRPLEYACWLLGCTDRAETGLRCGDRLSGELVGFRYDRLDPGA